MLGYLKWRYFGLYLIQISQDHKYHHNRAFMTFRYTVQGVDYKTSFIYPYLQVSILSREQAGLAELDTSQPLTERMFRENSPRR